MNIEIVQDLVEIGGNIVELIRDRKIVEAKALIEKANREKQDILFHNRQLSIKEINHNMVILRNQKAEILREIEKLPEEDAFHAKHRMREPIKEMFDKKISKLRAQKRKLSQPR